MATKRKAAVDMRQAPEGGETFQFANPDYQGPHEPVPSETTFSYTAWLHEQRRLGLESPAILNRIQPDGSFVREFQHVMPDGSVVTTDSSRRPEPQEVGA